MATYGYMRVSSRDQKEYRQADAFRRFEIPRRKIYFWISSRERILSGRPISVC